MALSEENIQQKEFFERFGISPEILSMDLEEIDADSLRKFLDPVVLEEFSNGNIPQEYKAFFDEIIQKVNVQYDPTRRMEVAKNLLEEKYHKEFEIVRYRGQSLGIDYYRVEAYEKTNPYLLFEARVPQDEKFIDDTYIIRKACNEMRDRLLSIISIPDGEVDLYIESSRMFANIDAAQVDDENVMEQFEPNNRLTIHFFFTLNSYEPVALSNNFIKIARELGSHKGVFKIYVVSPEKRREIFDYIDGRSRIYSSFYELTKDDYMGYFRFANGGVRLDERILAELSKRI